MAYRIKRTDSEIDEQMNWAVVSEESGISAVPGQIYEQGVKAALDWVLGYTDTLPIEEEPEQEPDDAD